MNLPKDDAAESLSEFRVPDTKNFMEMQDVITELCFEADK